MANKKKSTPRWVLELPSEKEERDNKSIVLLGGALFLLALVILVIWAFIAFIVGGAR